MTLWLLIRLVYDGCLQSTTWILSQETVEKDSKVYII